MSFLFRRKHKSGRSDSADSDEGNDAKRLPSKFGGGSTNQGSQRFGEAFRKNSMNSTRTGNDRGGVGGTSPSQHTAGNRRSQRSPNVNEPRSAGGFSSHSPRSPHQTSPGGSHGVGQIGGRKTATPRKEEVEEEAPVDDSGVPAEWAAKPSRGRRFTVNARPDLHKHVKQGESDESDEEDKFELLEQTLEKMKQAVDETAKEEEEGESGEESGDEGLGFRGRGDDRSASTKASKKSKKFQIPHELSNIRGYLYKKGHARRNWTKRIFVVRGKSIRLEYYSEKNGAIPKGYIDLQGARLYVPEEKKKRSDSRITSEFEFTIQERVGRRRAFELCALNEEDFLQWIQVLTQILQLQEDFKRHFPRKKGATIDDESYDEDQETMRWDIAQNYTAFGPGLYECRVGQEATFTIQANDEFGNPLSHSGEVRPSVVLESDELHYDVEVEDNEDGTYTARYCPAKLGDYELSIMVDDYDIYGSPYHPNILPAPVCTSHCVADGVGLICAVLDHPNEFVIVARNEFDELVNPEEELAFNIEMEKPLVLESVTYNGDCTYNVKYSVDCTKEELNSMQETNECLSGRITVTLNDGRSKLNIPRNIKGSPFSPGIAASLSPEDLAAAYTASEFSKLLNDANANGSASVADLKNPFITFSRMLKNSGLLRMQYSDGEQKNDPLASPGTDASSVASDRLESENEVEIPAQQPHDVPRQHNTQPNKQASGGANGLHHVVGNGTGSMSFASPGFSYSTPSTYFPMLSSTSTSPSFVMPGQPAPSQQPTPVGFETTRQQGLHRNEWIPQGKEAELVQQSLESRAKEIEKEKQDLMKKRQELDESRLLIDEQVRRMAEIGQQVHVESERVILQAQRLAASEPEGGSPLRYAVKENLINDPNQHAPQPQGVSPREIGSAPGSRSPQKSRTEQGKSKSGRVVLDKTLIALFDKHAVVLSRVYEYYKSQNGTHAVQLSDAIKLAEDYDITPTFISRKEIREIFDDVQERFGTSSYSLSYESFVEVLANIAVHSLSKPMFAHLYSTNLSKVNVLLTMWGLADPVKLSEIQEENSML